MLVPQGMTVRLRPADDLQHPPEACENYSESVYVDLFDAENRFGLWLRIGNRPNEGHAEVSICVYLPDGRLAFWFKRCPITGNDELNAGGLRVQVTQPMEALELAYDGPVVIFDDPDLMNDPKTLFSSHPSTSAAMRLSLRGISSVQGGEIVNPDGSAWDLDPEQAAYRGHFEQHVHGRGSLSIGSEVFRIDGFGYRDKSWGPRHWHNLYWHKWLPVSFGPDLGFSAALFGRREGGAVTAGHVMLDGMSHEISGVRLDSRYDGNGYQSGFTLAIESPAGSFSVEGQTLSHIPLRSVRVADGGRKMVVRIVKAMTLFRFGERTALGMSEYLDLLEDGMPVSQLRA